MYNHVIFVYAREKHYLVKFNQEQLFIHVLLVNKLKLRSSCWLLVEYNSGKMLLEGFTKEEIEMVRPWEGMHEWSKQTKREDIYKMSNGLYMLPLPMRLEAGRPGTVTIHIVIRYNNVILLCSWSYTGGNGGDGDKEELFVGDALVGRLLPLYGASGAAVDVHRRRRLLTHFHAIR